MFNLKIISYELLLKMNKILNVDHFVFSYKIGSKRK